MLLGLFILSFIVGFVQAIKECCEQVIPAENWNNKELYNQDILDGVSAKQRTKNLKNGKYKLEVEQSKYPEPHRDKDGKIIVENCLLYNEDLMKYGAVQTYKWVEQGKYNLSQKELEKERKRLKEKYECIYGLA